MATNQKIVLGVLFVLLLTVLIVFAVVIASQNSGDANEPIAIVTQVPTNTLAPSTPTQFFIPSTWTPAASPTIRPTDTPISSPTLTKPPTLTPTFRSTRTPTPSPTPTPTVLLLDNPDFNNIGTFSIPGWQWWALDNFEHGGPFDPGTSYETPLIKSADDPNRLISGPTLQIGAQEYVKFKIHVYQTIEAEPGLRVSFQARGGAWGVENGGIMLAAGIDRNGTDDCQTAQWGSIITINQDSPPVPLVSPEVIVGEDGKVTVCLMAEPQYAYAGNAAFFDDAEIVLDE